MSKQEKLKEKLLSRPKDFTWDELKSLLTSLDYELLKGKGSRRKFVHPTNKNIINLHEPHPDKVIKSYLINQIITKLSESGELNV